MEGLIKVRGIVLSERPVGEYDRLVTILLRDRTVRGSTGVVTLEDGHIRFLPNDPNQKTVSFPIAYEKKNG